MKKRNTSDKHVMFDYHQITGNIYIGTNFCCKVHFKKELIKEGIAYDISLEKERLDTPWGVKAFLWLPTKDHTAPTRQTLILGVQMLTSIVNWNKKVFVHCMNGHGRAPTLVAAYFITQGMSVDEAIAKIAKKRPEIHVEPAQVKMLRRFAKSVHIVNC